MKRFLTSILIALALVAGSMPALGARRDPCIDRKHRLYPTRTCKIERLKKRSFVVVALVDTGVNVYHKDFRLPSDSDMIGVHPSEFIEGFPKNAAVFDLSLNAPDYNSAMKADQAEWDAVEKERPYTFPGTKIIAGYVGDPAFSDEHGGHLIDDVSGHGTNTASLAGGKHGFINDPDILLVSLQGTGQDSLSWATDQSWIDIVSNSWGYVANAYVPALGGEHQITKPYVERGGSLLMSAGNGITDTGNCDRSLTTQSQTKGPPWHLVVGASSPDNRQPYCWHSIPVDVTSYGKVAAAAFRSTEGEVEAYGTSFSTPLIANGLAHLILEARRALNDRTEGPHDGVIAEGAPQTLPETGPLADGELTGDEVREVILKTATVEPFDTDEVQADPYVWPNTPLSFIYGGYGLVDSDTLVVARDVLFGREPMPERSDVEMWMSLRDQIGNALWDVLP